MGIRIGELLYRTRKELGIDQKSIYTGICTASNYSNYENDIRIPDFLTLNGILERMGQGIMSLSAYVSKEEMKYLQWRSEVSDTIRNREFKKLTILIEEESVVCPSLNKGLQEQFIFYVRGVIAENVLQDENTALECYESAIRCTYSTFFEKENFAGRIGKFEIGIYGLYVRLAVKKFPDRKLMLVRKLEDICDYIMLKITDVEEKVKCYPHLVCILGEIYKNILQKEEQVTGCFLTMKKRLEQAYQLLKECRYMYHVTEILRLLIFFQKKLRKNSSIIQQDYQTICKLYEMFDKSTEFIPYEVCENKWLFTILGEYLSRSRKKKGLSQEEISANICEPENYSRIERGRRKPTKNRYQALADKLEIEPRYYTEILNTGNYKALMLRRKISKVLFEGEYEKGKELLTQLEYELGEEKEKNRQYLEERKAIINDKLTNLPLANREEEIIRILSYTLDLSEIGKGTHVYIRNEINLLNQLVTIYTKQKKDEEAVELLQRFISDMQDSKNSIDGRFKETYLAVLNLEKSLANLGRFEEANDFSMKWAKMAVDRGHATLLDDYLVEISYNLEHMNYVQMKRKDKPVKICCLAVELSNIYGNIRTKKLIKEYYEKTYM